jgi:hypothetical protein
MRWDRFLKDDRGTSFEGIALSVSIIAVGFVASADMLDYLTKSRAKTEFSAPVQTAVAPNSLDYTPTASLPKLISRSVLDPCTGAVR